MDLVEGEDAMSSNRTPPLSLRGSKEVYEEMCRPPEDTPARRTMFERVRAVAALREKARGR